MKLTLTLSLCAGVLAAGCGGGDSKSDSKSSDQASTPTETQAKKGKKAPAKAKKAPPTAKTKKLSDKERKDAQDAVKSLVVCLRAQKAQVKTDSNAPKSYAIKAGNGTAIRITWKGNAADAYVSTTPNVRAVAKVVRKQGHMKVYHRRLIVVYDKPPRKAQKDLLDHCSGLKGIA